MSIRRVRTLFGLISSEIFSSPDYSTIFLQPILKQSGTASRSTQSNYFSASINWQDIVFQTLSRSKDGSFIKLLAVLNNFF